MAVNIKPQKEVNYDEAPEDIKGSGTMIDGQGTCSFCGQSRFVKMFPGEDPDTVATRDCECSEARTERSIKNTIFAVMKGIDKRLDYISEDLRNKLKVWIEPVARGEVKAITLTMDAATVIKITNKRDNPTCIVTRRDIEEIDEIDGVTE